jgi:hypothetical protein
MGIGVDNDTPGATIDDCTRRTDSAGAGALQSIAVRHRSEPASAVHVARVTLDDSVTM